jgi:hypothetical protein
MACLVSDDDGAPALIDAQFFVFSIVALVYFTAAFAAEPVELPTIPLGLAGLASVAALVYTGNKAVLRNAPAFSTITRSLGSGDVRSGDAIDIRGTNTVPEGASTEEQLASVRVRFGDHEVPVIPRPRGTASTTRLGTGSRSPCRRGSPGRRRCGRRDGRRCGSNEYQLTVATDAPVVTGLQPLRSKSASPSGSAAGRCAHRSTSRCPRPP